MKKYRNISVKQTGFSLVEVLAAMMIGSMVLIAVLTVYNRAGNISAAVTSTINDSSRPYEALQLLAEDLDKMISTDSDTNVVVVNRHVNNYMAAILAIITKYKDPTNKTQTYKEILWQCNGNATGDPNNMVLYRSYEGIEPEDKLLDRDRDVTEKNMYVPICDGVTYFGIKVFTGEDEPEVAFPGGMPLGVVLTISFAEPFVNEKGYYDVPEEDKYTRTIAFDKSRKIKFDVSEEESPENETVGTKLNIPVNTGTPSKDLKKK